MRASLIKDNAKKNIKKVLAGDEKGIARLVKKAYVGVDGVAKLFWGSTQDGPTFLDYIESTGTQYIDTGVIVNTNTRVEIDCVIDGLPPNCHAFGCSKAYLNERFHNFGVFARSESTVCCRAGVHNVYDSSSTAYESNVDVTTTSRHTYSLSFTEFQIDGTTKYSFPSNVSKNFSCDHSLYLFARHSTTKGVVDGIVSSMRLYSFKIYDGSTLIRDFKPCKDANGVICLYDLVEGKYYYNQGTGSFITEQEIDTDVNYLMLYDGSLGEAGSTGANVCADVTGGYTINDILLGDTYEASDVSFESTQVTMSAKKTAQNTANSINKMSTIITVKSFNVSGYKQIGCVAYANLNKPSSNTWFTLIILQNRGIVSGAVMGEYYIIANNVDLANGLNNSKFIKSKDISSAVNKNYYFAFQLSSTYTNSLATGSLYSTFLLKQDNWQTLCDVAGLNSSDYANEETLCSNSTAITQILSNASAVDFMLKQCTGTFMYYFVRSSTCLTALNNSTNKTKIHANEHWSKFLNMVA